MTRQIYRYRGTDRDGHIRFGIFEDTPDRLAAEVEKRYRQRWRDMAVFAGPGPVPPARDEELQVAGIGRRYGERRRTCWYEAPGTPAEHEEQEPGQ